MFDVRFHDLGPVARKRFDFVFYVVSNVNKYVRFKMNGGRAFIKKDIRHVTRGHDGALAHVSVVLMGVFAVMDKYECRRDLVDNSLDFHYDIFVKRELCVRKIAPEHFLRGYRSCGIQLFLFSGPEAASGCAACHDHKINFMALPGQLVQRASAPEFDVVRVGTDGKNIHFLI